MSDLKQEVKAKKTFGDWLKSVFESHVRDITDEKKRYLNTELNLEINTIGNNYKWARSLQSEFNQIQHLLKEKVLSCPHNQEYKKTKTEYWEQCELCGCSRFHKYNEDNFTNTYYERSFEIMETYKQTLTKEEIKILDDFYNRNIGDMSDSKKWDSYNDKMKSIFLKYPIWKDWKF